MVTIPRETGKMVGKIKEPKMVIMEIDGKIEFIPLRSVEEMEAACTIKIECMAQIYDETHENELRLENKE
jgi:hypothetical protein